MGEVDAKGGLLVSTEGVGVLFAGFQALRFRDRWVGGIALAILKLNPAIIVKGSAFDG